MPTPNYEFYGLNGTRLYYALDQLRTSATFRAMEDALAARYDNVVVVMANGVTPFKDALGAQYPETTGFEGRTRYIYIDTSTTTVVKEDGVWKSMSAEQILTHAIAHATDPNLRNPFDLPATSPGEQYAIDKTNTVTQEAGLSGPSNTANPLFKESAGEIGVRVDFSSISDSLWVPSHGAHHGPPRALFPGRAATASHPAWQQPRSCLLWRRGL